MSVPTDPSHGRLTADQTETTTHAAEKTRRPEPDHG